MAESKKFSQAGETEERETWNKAGTRLWRMTYTLVDVRPSWRNAPAPKEEPTGASDEGETHAKAKKATKPKPKAHKKQGARKTSKKR
jgi:hypothetical protein